MLQEICKICNQEIKEDNHFFKNHRISQEKYYLTYYKKIDLFTNQLLPFKSRESYFLNDFLNKTNLKNFLFIDDIAAKDYCKNYLIKRKTLKNLIWTPTQVELRSLIAPSILTYNRLFDNYYELCASLGFKNKLINLDLETSSINRIFDLKTGEYIICDTREQKPLMVKNVQIGTLDFGDYKINNENYGKVCIERKSLNDFISTLSKNYDRFSNEIERAKLNDYYMFVIVESDFDLITSFNSKPWINKFTQASPEFICHRMRELCQKFNMLQFVFGGNRDECENLIYKLLTNGDLAKKYDIQFTLDSKIL